MTSSTVTPASASTAPGANASTTSAAPGLTSSTNSAAAAVPGSTQALINNVLQYQYNPVAIQQASMATLSAVTNGTIQIVDPTNPFVYAIEASACNTAAFMVENAALNRRQYPVASQTPQDLYYHMSDKDYIGRFSTPAGCNFTFMFNEAEVLAAMVPNAALGVNMLVIPRNTTVTIAGVVFSLQYPIKIQQMQHGGISILYDTTITSPLQTLTTNVIVPRYVEGRGTGTFIMFDVFMTQFDILSGTSNLDSATDFTVNVPLNTQFYYCRVYSQDPNTGLWTEIQTTHSAEVYDINVPTAALQVLTDAQGNTSLNVTIPQIYTSTSLLNQGIRYDIYETIGPINMVLADYAFNQYGITWLAIDTNDNTAYTAPLPTLQNYFAFSTAVCVGGANAVSFETLRTQVIMNAIGDPETPITNIQLNNELTDLGYTVLGNIDNITNRSFLAQSALPQPANPKLITAAASCVATVAISIPAIIELTSVVNNGSSVTIKPDTLYQNLNGTTTLVSSSQVTNLSNLPATQRALNVTNGNYLFTPFHYVLDMSNEEFNVRPYYLDNPTIPTKIFIAENDTTLLQVNTGSYGIQRTANGNTITIVTESSAAWQAIPDSEVFVQLAFIPYGESDYAYLNGVQTGLTTSGERIFTFDLSTTYNIDSNNNMELTKFLMFTTLARTVLCPLTQSFTLTYGTTAPMPTTFVASSIDQQLGKFLLPGGVVGVTQETLDVELGYALTTLWARARTVAAAQPYQTYQASVPYVYQSDIYQTDNNGSAISIVDNQVVFTVLHAKGTPVVDNNGVQVNQFNKGDVILDTNGQPIPIGPTQLQYTVDIMMIDGCYYFATDEVATTYLSSAVETMIGWLTGNLETIQSELLEQTDVFFYPETSLGMIEISTADGTTQSILAQQSFVVNITVSKEVAQNAVLLATLKTSTVQTLGTQMANNTISIDAILSALKDVYGDDVIATSITGLGGNANLTAFTIVNPGDQCSLAKQLYVQPDNSLSVQENVTLNPIQLTQNSIAG